MASMPGEDGPVADKKTRVSRPCRTHCPEAWPLELRGSRPANPTGHDRKEHGLGGWATIFIRGCLCNWMVSLGVVGAMISISVTGKCLALWIPVFLSFYVGFEHSVVSMFLFPTGLTLGGNFSVMD